MIDPTLRREFQTLSLRAVADRTPARSTGQSTGGYGAIGGGSAACWPLVPGPHRMAARDGRGRMAETSIVVK